MNKFSVEYILFSLVVKQLNLRRKLRVLRFYHNIVQIITVPYELKSNGPKWISIIYCFVQKKKKRNKVRLLVLSYN